MVMPVKNGNVDTATAGRIGYTTAIWMLLFAGLVLRFLIAPIWQGYGPDVQTFMAWADMAYTRGLPNLYQSKEFLDYPPAYMYVLYTLAAVRDVFGLAWESSAALILFKLPAMLADVATGYFIYRIAIKYISLPGAIGLAALYVLNPAILINSTVWGQVDSIFMAVVLGYLLLLQEKRYRWASLLLAIAILLKPQGLLFGPFIVISLLRGRNWRDLWQSLLTGAGTIIVLLLPFGIISHGFGWLFKLYFSTLSQYAYASLNAFNLMTLMGGNFIELNGTNLSYQTWGMLLVAASLVYCAILCWRSDNRKGAVLFFAYLFLAAFVTFAVKMHERYLFYALLPLLMSYVYLKDRRILMLFGAYSATYFINVAYVLKSIWGGNPFIGQWDIILLVVSALNVVFIAYGAWLGWRLFGGNMKQEITTTNSVEKETDSPGWGDLFDPAEANAPKSRVKKRLFRKKDWLLSLVLTAVYSIFALVNLGSFQAPETFWKPAVPGETLVFDLGAEKDISRLHTYAGVGHGKFTYSFSDDGTTWAKPIEIDNDHTKAFTWNVQKPETLARYVKLEVKEAGFTIHEVAFFEKQTSAGTVAEDELVRPLPVVSVRGENLSDQDAGKPENVVDEQQIVPYSPTFMNGTYFDEIYHARTAYEHLHKIEPYENTHPPLGKIFIAAGIAVFGMDPFGWRIVGTLFGIAMVPIMYAFGLRLFGKTRYGFIAAFLFAFDFMHFAQTRIATIDVYGVFFIILMFYFMYKYMTMNAYRDGLLRTLIPLGLSGVFFGLGAASKWIALYGGAGLAVLLAITLMKRYKEHRLAKLALSVGEEAAELPAHETDVEQPVISAAEKKRNDTLARAAADAAFITSLPEQAKAAFERAAKSFWKPTVLTLAWCLLFFIIIPASVYVLSYIPFMMVPGPGHGLKEVISYQKHMFDYHKNLVATHPFASPWYEWPVMARPIWYYSAQFLPAGKLSSIVSFGNPMVWWGGLVALIASVYVAIKRKNKILIFLIIGFCAQYLPWVGVPRLTFIYHYFAMVPFLVLMLTYFIGRWFDRSKGWRMTAIGYLAATFVLFVLYYPILSGMVIDASYSANWLRLLPSWNFF